VHRYGKESQWWENAGINPLEIASNLWRETHSVQTFVNFMPTNDSLPAQVILAEHAVSSPASKKKYPKKLAKRNPDNGLDIP